jgi:hypothetical protein
MIFSRKKPREPTWEEIKEGLDYWRDKHWVFVGDTVWTEGVWFYREEDGRLFSAPQFKPGAPIALCSHNHGIALLGIVRPGGEIDSFYDTLPKDLPKDRFAAGI